MTRIAFLLLIGTATCSCASVAPPTPLKLAITIDDLPVHGPIPAGNSAEGVAAELIGALRRGGASQAIGMINGNWTTSEPQTASILSAWRNAGLPLANHGWSHRNANELSASEFEQELTRNEPLLRRLSGGSDWRWFRYPFLSEGDNPAKRKAARALLARHGYRIAAVTMDFSDWQWTAPYARCVASKDQQSIARLERLYLNAAARGITRSRELSMAVHGRDIPYVVLLHGGAFTARMMPQLLGLYRREGFRFVGLDEAERDPAYASDVAPGADGPPATLEGRAAAKGIPIPPPPVDGATIAALCT